MHTLSLTLTCLLGPPFNELRARLLPLCLGTLYLCTRRSAAWKPGASGHVTVAMPVEVPFSFLSFLLTSALIYLFSLKWGKCWKVTGPCKSKSKHFGLLAFHCWIIFGFIIGCHTSHQGCSTGVFCRTRSFGGHSGESEAWACGSPPCLQEPGCWAGAVAAPSQRGIWAGNIKRRHATGGGAAAGRVPGKADGPEFMAFQEWGNFS